MDNDKPFKTIEVVDSRTGQVCKVACMSCIRGHRTTACGIPVCRTKLFWTVKRPGRPANACSCRYGGKGGCKCVVVKSSCPHKAVKGVKRSGECRCDEQGRYCCLIEPQHWAMLLSLQKPTVVFYTNREDLADSHGSPMAMSLPVTPAFSGNSPRAYGDTSVSSTPGPPDITQPMRMMSSPFNGLQSPTRQLTPRFDRMNVTASQSDEQYTAPDVLAWNAQALHTPQNFQPSQYQPPPQLAERSSCCKRAASPPLTQDYAPYVPLSQGINTLPTSTATGPFGFLELNAGMSGQLPQQAAFDKFNNDYFAFQFPSAMCQTCGLSGCTCRNCPPVMQNTDNGSWAQMCGRKHARTATYEAPATLHTYETQPTPQQHQQQPAQYNYAPPPREQNPASHSSFSYQSTPDLRFGEAQQSTFGLTHDPYLQSHPSDLHSPQLLDDFRPFDPGQDFGLSGGAHDMDISELLMEDLDQAESGCCCGD